MGWLILGGLAVGLAATVLGRRRWRQKRLPHDLATLQGGTDALQDPNVAGGHASSFGAASRSTGY